MIPYGRGSYVNKCSNCGKLELYFRSQSFLSNGIHWGMSFHLQTWALDRDCELNKQTNLIRIVSLDSQRIWKHDSRRCERTQFIFGRMSTASYSVLRVSVGILDYATRVESCVLYRIQLYVCCFDAFKLLAMTETEMFSVMTLDGRMFCFTSTAITAMAAFGSTYMGDANIDIK
jgi:hypothetical protein